MALVKAAALGAIAAISVPYVLRGKRLTRAADTLRRGDVVAGRIRHPVSVPIFLLVAGLAWILLKVTGD